MCKSKQVPVPETLAFLFETMKLPCEARIGDEFSSTATKQVDCE